jgi:hypothetical protein
MQSVANPPHFPINVFNSDRWRVLFNPGETTDPSIGQCFAWRFTSPTGGLAISQ